MCTHIHAHTQLFISACTHASRYTHVDMALPRHGHIYTPSCKHIVCTHTFHTPPPSHATPPHTPPLTWLQGVGDNLSQSREETHLEVSVDDPHLVTMENGLQDLLDAVTIANSGQVS